MTDISIYDVYNYYEYFCTTVCVAWDSEPPTPPPRAIGLFPCCFCHRVNLGKVFCICTSHPPN